MKKLHKKINALLKNVHNKLLSNNNSQISYSDRNYFTEMQGINIVTINKCT